MSDKCIPFKVEVLQCMINYMDQEPLQDQLVDPSFAGIMIDALCGTTGPFILKKTAVDMVLASRRHVDLTDMFIDQKVVDW